MKKNKSNAADWQQETKAAAEAIEELSNQRIRLYYAAEKTSESTPCAETIERLGYPAAAMKLRQARTLMSDAYYLLTKEN